MAKIIIDPENYYRNCKPRPSDEVEEDINKFNSELSLLRNKYKIADFVYVLRATTDNGDLLTSGSLGSEIVCRSLVERAFIHNSTKDTEADAGIAKNVSKGK